MMKTEIEIFFEEGSLWDCLGNSVKFVVVFWGLNGDVTRAAAPRLTCSRHSLIG